MPLEMDGNQPDNGEATDPYMAVVERKIGEKEISDEGAIFIVEIAKNLALACTFGDLDNPQQVRRAKGAVDVLNILGQQNLVDVALSKAAQTRPELKKKKKR